MKETAANAHAGFGNILICALPEMAVGWYRARVPRAENIAGGQPRA
jgi:hypothetical protein